MFETNSINKNGSKLVIHTWMYPIWKWKQVFLHHRNALKCLRFSLQTEPSKQTNQVWECGWAKELWFGWSTAPNNQHLGRLHDVPTKIFAAKFRKVACNRVVCCFSTNRPAKSSFNVPNEKGNLARQSKTTWQFIMF